MSYTITTVSRRRFMVKTKSKQGQSTPAASQSAAAGTSKAAEPEMFIRAPYRRPVRVASTPWWTNWLAITLVNALVVAVVGGLYVWANGADSDEGRYVPQRTMVRSPSPSPATTPAHPAPSAPESSPPTAAVHQVAASASDAIDRAVRDGGRKVILPANVAGNCSIGESGVKDFGRCLAENGGRAR